MDKKPGEYWKVPLTPEEQEQLDVDLIEALNERHDEKMETEGRHEKAGRWRLWIIKIAGLITVLIFLVIVLNNFIKILTLPSLDFLVESRELARDPEIKKLRRAVVEVRVSGRRGTGFNVHPDGLVITNYHVVEDAKITEIKFPGELIYIGREWINLPKLDLALIKITGENLPTLELEYEADIHLGENVIVIGNPLGFNWVVEKGEIAGYANLEDWDEQVIMIKGPIYRGSSGSPVFNYSGRVIAVIFGAVTPTENEQEEVFGLAVPISTLTRYMED